MFVSILHFDRFYKTREGRTVRLVLQRVMRQHFKKTKETLGVGYVSPYMNQILSLLPSSIGIPEEIRGDLRNIVHTDTLALPLESNSLESVFMIHGLEYCQFPLESLQEIWRVLKSEGQLILIVPNRRGLWAHTEWSPFGHGQPFSSSQIRKLLSETHFICDELTSSLFTPPLRWRVMFKLSPFFEKYCRFIVPMMGGVNVVIARKQTYAPIKPSKGMAVPVTSVLKPVSSKSPYTSKEKL